MLNIYELSPCYIANWHIHLGELYWKINDNNVNGTRILMRDILPCV